MIDSQEHEDLGELRDVAEFLAGTVPFNVLDHSALKRAAESLRISYHRHGESFTGDDPEGGLRILRSGAVDLRDDANKLLDRLGEGESFAILNLNAESTVVATVIEDALIYRLQPEDYAELRSGNRDFDRHFSSQRSRRLRRAARYEPNPHEMLRPVSDLMTRDVFTISKDATVHECAVAMSERRVSSAIVMEGESLVGIVTDRDLRTRLLAERRDYDTSVSDIMTPEPHSVDASATVFDVTLEMTRCGFHHFPVLSDGRLVGAVTTSDLMLARRDDPVYLVQHISRAENEAAIVELVAGLPDLMASWVNSGMRAAQVSQILTAVSDAIAVRLINLAEEELGPAPAPWAWLAFGSQARAEQLLGADQDNGIVIADEVAESDLGWYEALATRVSDGLATCGYKYCPGGIMATNPLWRLRLRDWQSTVRGWTNTPTSDAVMRVSIFFDIRGLYGDKSLVDEIQKVMLSQASGNSIFQAALAANVLATRPPLGIFRRFVVDRDGEHRDALDIKKRAVLPVTEITRLHALAHGIKAVNTDERLKELTDAGHLTMVDSRNLTDALHFVQKVRLQHHVSQTVAGEKLNNFLNPRSLPRLSREHLRDAFTIIDEAQGAIRQTYRAGLG